MKSHMWALSNANYNNFTPSHEKPENIHINLQCLKNFTKSYPANIYMFKVNNRNTKKKCGICSELTIKTPEQHHYVQNNITDIVLVSLLLNLTSFTFSAATPFSSVSIVDFKQVNV